jgi:hypothetical protein
VVSSIECEGQGRLEPCGISLVLCRISYVDFRELQLDELPRIPLLRGWVNWLKTILMRDVHHT